MRSFFCLELDPTTATRLAKVGATLQSTNVRVRWVRAGLMHITLKFLGEIDPNDIIEYQSLTQSVADQCQPFKLTLDKLGVFPNFDKPRVVWAGSSNVPTELEQLQANLDQQLQPFGFRREKYYTPHVTLGRVKESNPGELARLSEKIQTTSFKPLTVRMDGVTLMGSVLGSGGPKYSPLFHVPIK